jgi:hypothetical protein
MCPPCCYLLCIRRNIHFIESPLLISPSTIVSPSICGYFETIILNRINVKGSTFRNASLLQLLSSTGSHNSRGFAEI